jgi:hypothetical protein
MKQRPKTSQTVQPYTARWYTAWDFKERFVDMASRVQKGYTKRYYSMWFLDERRSWMGLAKTGRQQYRTCWCWLFALTKVRKDQKRWSAFVELDPNWDAFESRWMNSDKMCHSWTANLRPCIAFDRWYTWIQTVICWIALQRWRTWYQNKMTWVA